MTEFAYQGIRPDGRRVAGRIEAEDRPAALRQLAGSDVIITAVRRQSRGLAGLLRLGARPLRVQRVIFFARSLAILHRSGVPLASALELVASQATEATERRVIENVRSDVLKGKSLADALRGQAPRFPEILSGAVEVGEAAGALDTTLMSAADLLERDETARAELRAALRYPLFVVGAVGAALVVLLTFVVPKFARSYEEMGASLPTPTVILIRVSHLLVASWYYALPAVALLGVLGWRWYRTVSGRRALETLVLRTPVLGPLAVKSLTSRTCEILKVLSQSGLPLLGALEMGARTIGHSLVARELLDVRNAVAEGSDLASRFRTSRVFPPLTGELISVGERSGALEEMLGAAADYYRLETERERKRVTALIEPTLTVLLGLLVLGIALAIFLPMWDSISLYRRGG